MPQTKVNTPDGRTITVNHPEGASQEQILRFAKIQYQQREAPQEQPVSPVSESGFENYLAGVGKAFSDIGLGARQRFYDVASAIPTPGSISARGSLGDIASQRRDELQEEAAARRQRDRPLTETRAGLAGEITGNIAAFLPAGGVAGTLPRAMTLGATEGALIPSVSNQETVFNAATGGALGAVGELGSRGVKRLVQPFSRRGSAKTAVQILDDAGVDLDVAQRSGNEGAQRLRSALGDNPLTAATQRNFAEKQQRQFTKAVLKTIGVNGDELSPSLLNEALDDVDRIITGAAKQNPMRLDPQFMAELRMVSNRIPSEVGDTGIENALLRNIDNIINSANSSGQLPGDAFVGIRGNLSKLSTKTPIARDIQEAMLDALDRAGGSSGELRNALAKYRNIKIIQNALDKGTEKTVSPRRLANTFGQIRNRSVSQRGLGHPSTVELAQLAAAGSDLLPETLGNSGTFGRMLVGEGVLFGGGLAGGLASGQDVGDAAAIGAGAAALPLILQRGFNSQGLAGKYMSGAGPAMSPLIDALIRQGIITGGLQQQRE